MPRWKLSGGLLRLIWGKGGTRGGSGDRRKVKMLQRSAQDRGASVAVSRVRQDKPEEGANQPGELVSTDKVEEVLHGLDLPPAVEGEDHLSGPSEDYDQ